MLPIDDVDKPCEDLLNDELVKGELSKMAGIVVSRGSRFVNLANAIFQIAKYLNLSGSKGDVQETKLKSNEGIKEENGERGG